jgi:hypothetical protein
MSNRRRKGGRTTTDDRLRRSDISLTKDEDPLNALPPDGRRGAQQIADTLEIPSDVAVITLLVLLDDAIGDKIVGHPEADGIRFRETFPVPELLDVAGSMPSVQTYIARIQPPFEPLRMSPEAERLFKQAVERS